MVFLLSTTKHFRAVARNIHNLLAINSTRCTDVLSLAIIQDTFIYGVKQRIRTHRLAYYQYVNAVPGRLFFSHYYYYS
jgi:hypothetical protein